MIGMAQATWPEVGAAAARRVLAILPIGAVEQHGYHLSLTTDSDMATGVARVIATRLDAVLLRVPADPRPATADKGRGLTSAIAANCLTLIADFRARPDLP